MHILDQEAPGLADRLRSLDPQTRQGVLVRACIFAAGGLDDSDVSVRSLLNALRSGRTVTKEQAVEAASLAEAADTKYFTLQEQGASAEEWSKWFALARFLTAISITFGEMPPGDPADAVYELCNSQDDPSPLVNLIRRELAGS